MRQSARRCSAVVRWATASLACFGGVDVGVEGCTTLGGEGGVGDGDGVGGLVEAGTGGGVGGSATCAIYLRSGVVRHRGREWARIEDDRSGNVDIFL